MNAEEQLGQLRQKQQRISEAKVKAETRVESARKSQKEALDKLKKLGIDDPKTIPAKLEEFKKQAEDLLAEINGEIPEQYKGEHV